MNLLVAALLCAGCEAQIDAPLAGPGTIAPPVANAPGAVAPPIKPRTGRAFSPSADRVALLPFHVRLNRLAAVAGLPATDPMFAQLVARKLDLGAHDFGANTAPDLTWSAQRLSTWIQALFPVCDDSRLRARFPDWRTGLDLFAQAAWGRPSTMEDLQLLDEVAADEPAANRWRASCLTLLSSLELVAQ